MGSLKWVGNELWCACGLQDDKVADIRKVPHVEFCIADHDWDHVRISGVCTVSTDPQDRALFLDLVPTAKGYFSGPDDPNFAVLRTKVERIRYRLHGADNGRKYSEGKKIGWRDAVSAIYHIIRYNLFT